MLSRDQPTPPFNSPYQHAMKPATLLQSPPAYPSPARSDSEPSKYSVDALGLYNYAQPYPTSGPSAPSALYPPSPQPTEAWPQYNASTSPLMGDAIVDPWASGAYDHPVSRSPLPWAGNHTSHRSSLSSTREMSIFSHDGSEHAFPQIKPEVGSPWATDEESSSEGLGHHPLTVAPERLTTGGIFPYDNSYSSPPLPKFETVPTEIHDSREHDSMSQASGVTPRTRLRRNHTRAEEAKYSCHLCEKFFLRSYNLKQHLQTHNPSRPKEHGCPHSECGQRFVRKTDLDRHEKSVHLKLKIYRCVRCDNRFARKDTLRRHEEDGCPRRNEVSNPQIALRYRDDSFPASPHSF